MNFAAALKGISLDVHAGGKVNLIRRAVWVWKAVEFEHYGVESRQVGSEQRIWFMMHTPAMDVA